MIKCFLFTAANVPPQVDTRAIGAGARQPQVVGKEKPSLKQRVKGLQQERYNNRMVGH